jgi:flavin reductase (DIM6/NTAB) family NADH-FMN oxidoreductase RutF
VVFFKPEERDKTLFPHDPFKAMIVPRPIGWISTMSSAGQVNLAPYSFFNAFSSWPMIVGFCSEGEKDSQTFAMQTGEFTWSMATYPLRQQMNATSAPLPRGESEFHHAGLETAPCRLVKPPRVAASPAALECRVTQTLRLQALGGEEMSRVLVLGQVVGIHVDTRYVKDGRLDAVAMQPIARCGYDEYTVIDRVFSIVRPAGGGIAGGGDPRSTTTAPG